MRKLSNARVKGLVAEKKRGVSSGLLAVEAGVSRRRVEQLWREYRLSGKLPVLGRPGPRPQPVSKGERLLVLKYQKRYRCGAVLPEKVLKTEEKRKTPHNRIHKILLEAHLAHEEKRKKTQRKWVRYERKHSLSLVHTDWHENGKTKVIAFLDDASRHVLACGEYTEATSENTLEVLDQTLEYAQDYGSIKQILTDRGTQFYTTQKDKQLGASESQFQKRLRERGIDHILARVNHPQTNGKLERWFYTYDKHRHAFPTLQKFLNWYNTIRPHMSLDFDTLETPTKAFNRKHPPETNLGLAAKHFKW